MDPAPFHSTARPWKERTDDREVAVMPGATNRLRGPARSRWIGLLIFGPCLAGCAAMSQDVDAYYRQMAINYHEAAENAKLDEVSAENQLRVLGATGDQQHYVKMQRKLERLRAWEEKCTKEEKRFAKAADWMESHFDIKKPKLASKAGDESAVRDGPIGYDSKPTEVLATDSEGTSGHTTEEPHID
jgi:hypothetical protein